MSSFVGKVISVVTSLSPDGTVFLFEGLLITGPESGLCALVRTMVGELKEALTARDDEKVQKLAGVGVRALSLSLDNKRYKVASELAVIAVGLLKDALDEPDSEFKRRLTEHLSTTITNGLAEAVVNHRQDVVNLIDERGGEFNAAVVEGSEASKGYATTLSEALVLLLTMSIKLNHQELSNILSSLTVKALTEAAEDDEPLVEKIIQGRTEAFKVAITEKRMGLAKSLSQTAVAVLLEAIKPTRGTPSPTLIRILPISWVEALADALQTQQTLVTDLLKERTDALSNAIELEEFKTAETLSKAGVEVLLAAIVVPIPDKQRADLVEKLSLSWVVALHTAGQYGGKSKNKVRELVDGRITEFKDVVSKGDKERAKVLAKAGAVVMLAAIKEDKMVSELSLSLVQTLNHVLISKGYCEQEEKKLIAEMVDMLRKANQEDVEKAKNFLLGVANSGEYQQVVNMIEENWN